MLRPYESCESTRRLEYPSWRFIIETIEFLVVSPVLHAILANTLVICSVNVLLKYLILFYVK